MSLLCNGSTSIETLRWNQYGGKGESGQGPDGHCLEWMQNDWISLYNGGNNKATTTVYQVECITWSISSENKEQPVAAPSLPSYRLLSISKQLPAPPRPVTPMLMSSSSCRPLPANAVVDSHKSLTAADGLVPLLPGPLISTESPPSVAPPADETRLWAWTRFILFNLFRLRRYVPCTACCPLNR